MKTTVRSAAGEHPTVTQAMVSGLWQEMLGAYGTKAIDKPSASEMKAIAGALSLMGIVEREAFLRRYTTTIGRRIYVPFVIGEPNPQWSLWSQIVVCVHEHQHVEQLVRDGWLKFMSRYLMSSSSRALYEAEAYRCDMELEFWHSGGTPSPKSLAGRLRGYNCSNEDCRVAEAMLDSSAETIRRGGIVNASSKKALAWLEQHAPALKKTA